MLGSGAKYRVSLTHITSFLLSSSPSRMSSLTKDFSMRSFYFISDSMISSSRNYLISWFSMISFAPISIINCSVETKTKSWSMFKVMEAKKHHPLQKKDSKDKKVKPKRLMKMRKMLILKKPQKRTLLNSTDYHTSSGQSKTMPRSSQETVTEWVLNTNFTSTTNFMVLIKKMPYHIQTGFISVRHKHHRPDNRSKKTQ